MHCAFLRGIVSRQVAEANVVSTQRFRRTHQVPVHEGLGYASSHTAPRSQVVTVEASSSAATVLGFTLSHVVLTFGGRRGQRAVPGSLLVTVAEERQPAQTAHCPSELLGNGLVTCAHLSPTGKGQGAAWGDEPCEQSCVDTALHGSRGFPSLSPHMKLKMLSVSPVWWLRPISSRQGFPDE